MEQLKNLDYPKQFIFFEQKGKKIYKIIDSEENAEQVDEYLWEPISTIAQKYIDGELYHLIQHEDKRLGWIKLDESLQILRFEPKVMRFINDNFISHEINSYMKNDKDFPAHFQNKMLNIKSEISYNGEKLYGVFIKDKFYGFHPEKYFEEVKECNISLDETVVSNKKLFKFSNFKKPVKDVEVNGPVLISYFLENNIGRAKVNSNEYYWISLEGLEKEVMDQHEDHNFEISESEKYLKDIQVGINKEREQSKEIIKTVLEANKYIKSEKDRRIDFRRKKLESSFKNAQIKIKNYEKNLNDLQANLDESKAIIKEKENVQSHNKNIDNQLKKENNKLSKENQLIEKRLEQQKDYNRRLELQRNKYKDRMNVLEERINKFNK